jgi:hypothetical protein
VIFATGFDGFSQKYKERILIYILAGSDHQAEYCAKQNALPPSQWISLRSPHQLLGLPRGRQVWYYGTYYMRPNIGPLMDMIGYRECKTEHAPMHARRVSSDGRAPDL